MTMSAVITLWELLTKCQTITSIINGSDKLPWLPTDFITSGWWVQISIQWSTWELGKPLYRIWVSSFSHISGRNRKNQSWYWLEFKRQKQLTKKSIVSSFKLQQACEDKIYFILTCPCTIYWIFTILNPKKYMEERIKSAGSMLKIQPWNNTPVITWHTWGAGTLLESSFMRSRALMIIKGSLVFRVVATVIEPSTCPSITSDSVNPLSPSSLW
jgi:hypothetical protein